MHWNLGRCSAALAAVLLAATAGASEAKKPARKPPAVDDAKRRAAAEQAAEEARQAALIVRAFDPGSPEATLRDMIHCGADVRDEAKAFDCYLALQVLQNRDTETAVTQIRHYSWKVFRSRADSYAVVPAETAAKEFALKITRREPEKCDAAAKQCKFFLVSRVRDLPAPVTLQWEENTWRVHSTSL